MGITNSNKELSVDRINCGDTFNVTLSINAAPDIVKNPTDIVLILDRSGSMSGSPIANLKNGVKKFIEIIDEATDSAQDGHIGNGSRIGIVSFASNATQDTALITSVADLNAAVNALSTGGLTNHADAFTKAVELFDAASPNAKVMVMFTDGKTTTGAPPEPIAAMAKAQGIIIYCIGLSGDGGIDETALISWASEPTASHVAITPNDEELEDIFEDLAKNISNPGAVNITIKDTLFSCFKILSLDKPTKGTATLLDMTSLVWHIDELGVSTSEGASLKFTVQHVGPCSGTVEVNEYITYDDDSGNIVHFPSPTIEVDCDDDIIISEGCPTPVNVTFEGCQDTLEFDASEICLDSVGRILQLDVTLKNICPNRRVALAVILDEVSNNNIEYQRGIKTFVVPAHTKDSCKNVTIRCITFVLPESLNVSGSTCGICGERKFKARFIAHYIDNDFKCCSAN